MQKHGYSVEIVFENLSEQESFDIEVDTILEMRYIYGEVMCNILSGGQGISLPLEVRKKISRSLTGFTQSENHRKANSLSKIGIKPSSNTIAAAILSNIRRKGMRKPELSQKYLGDGNPNASKIVYELENKVTGELFVGTRVQFYEKYNLDRNKLKTFFSKNCKRKSAYGWVIIKEKDGTDY